MGEINPIPIKIRYRIVRRAMMHKRVWCEYCTQEHFEQKSTPPQTHHINNDLDDKRLANLLLVSPECHRRIHGSKKSEDELKREGTIPRLEMKMIIKTVRNRI